jgi:DnaJ-domain-containing protein 1
VVDEDDVVIVLDSDEHAWWAARDELERVYAPPKRHVEEEQPRRSAFEEYFSTESLFTWGTPAPDTDTGDGPASVIDLTDPYLVLDVPRTASWDEIAAAHRRLAKLHHPDRLIGASDAERFRSERQMRELNIAYSELRRRRAK